MLTYAMLMVKNYLATLEQEEGQGMAEYGLILALIAVVVIVALNVLGPAISNLMTSVANDL
jgi:pilus assembly protein Flp/PilA